MIYIFSKPPLILPDPREILNKFRLNHLQKERILYNVVLRLRRSLYSPRRPGASVDIDHESVPEYDCC